MKSAILAIAAVLTLAAFTTVQVHACDGSSCEQKKSDKTEQKDAGK